MLSLNTMSIIVLKNIFNRKWNFYSIENLVIIDKEDNQDR